MRDSADSLDHASEAEENFRQAAIENMRQRMKPPADFDGKHCMECEDAEIPQARLDMGFWRCVNCQQTIERNSKLYRV